MINIYFNKTILNVLSAYITWVFPSVYDNCNYNLFFDDDKNKPLISKIAVNSTTFWNIVTYLLYLNTIYVKNSNL